MQREQCKNCKYFITHYIIDKEYRFFDSNIWGCEKYSATTLRNMKECGFYTESRKNYITEEFLNLFQLLQYTKEDLLKANERLKQLENKLDYYTKQRRDLNCK